MIPEGVIEVGVRVHDDRHRVAGQLAEVVEDLLCLDMRGAGIDDEGLSATQHDPDVLVVERVPAHEESIAEFDPAVCTPMDAW